VRWAFTGADWTPRPQAGAKSCDGGTRQISDQTRFSCSKATSASGWLCPSAPFTVAVTPSAVLFSQSHHFYSDPRRFLYRNQSVHNLLLVY
jgi:hypothetical protein